MVSDDDDDGDDEVDVMTRVSRKKSYQVDLLHSADTPVPPLSYLHAVHNLDTLK